MTAWDVWRGRLGLLSVPAQCGHPLVLLSAPWGEERAGAPSHRAHLPDPGALAGREARYCRWSPALNTPSRWTPRKQGLTTPSGGINFRQDSGLLCPPLVSPRNDRAAL